MKVWTVGSLNLGYSSPNRPIVENSGLNMFFLLLALYRVRYGVHGPRAHYRMWSCDGHKSLPLELPIDRQHMVHLASLSRSLQTSIDTDEINNEVSTLYCV